MTENEKQIKWLLYWFFIGLLIIVIRIPENQRGYDYFIKECISKYKELRGIEDDEFNEIIYNEPNYRNSWQYEHIDSQYNIGVTGDTIRTWSR